jgi:multidrug efflux pump subunit AcrA (membrane-fusion protein)
MTQDTGKPSGSPTRGRVWRLSFGIGAPLAALALVLLLRPRARPVATGGHEAMLMTASDSARPVSLTAAEAQRIGVTFTTASVGPLAREVRTVGQVTFDETRATVIAPKVEGWVERLFVDYTGMSVQTGAPLLTIYSAMLVSAQEELLLAKRLASDLAANPRDAASHTGTFRRAMCGASKRAVRCSARSRCVRLPAALSSRRTCWPARRS